ncbi:MAG: site-2 protease family protein [Candidatus Thermoplasmatota archaeon]|nr:site-2 protease family protein [Candidatus Thermoplasmatota archaeon]
MREDREQEMDMSGLFTGPPLRTLFGRVIAPPGRVSPANDQKRERAARMVGQIVSRRFIVEESRFDEAGIFLRIKMDRLTGEEMFDEVRRDLKKYGLYPRLATEGGRTFVLVYPLPARKKGRITVNLVLLFATIITTVWAGAILWMSRTREVASVGDLFGVLLDPMDLLMGGLTFAFPLLLILGTHELGHYFASRRYGIDATLPYFIPIPPFISPIGTFGALISMKEPISNKKALIDIGAAGPIAGFIVAIPVTIVGLLLTKAYPVSVSLTAGDSVMIINPPLLFHGFMALLGVPDEGVLYPTAFAGWLGLFVTALNLLPVGQLDGGHIIRGALGERSKYVSTGAMVLMVILGVVTGFTTYIFFAILILILGARHPPPLDDISPLSKRQWAVAGLSLLIMALTFHPVPLQAMKVKGGGLELGYEWSEHFASPYAPNYENFTLENDGSDDIDIDIRIHMGGEMVIPSITNKTLDAGEVWTNISQSSYFVYRLDGWFLLLMGPKHFTVEKRDTCEVSFVIGCSLDTVSGNWTDVRIEFGTDEGEGVETSFRAIRSSMFLELSQGDYHGSKVINGTLWKLADLSGSVNLSISRRNATGIGTFIFHSMAADFVRWSSSEPFQIVVGPGEERDLVSLEWTSEDRNAISARFTMELDKNTSVWDGEEIIIGFRTSGNQSGSRSITVR